MRVAVFIFAVLAFAAVSEEGSAKKLKKKVQAVQSDGVIQKLEPFQPDDPTWIALKRIISNNIDESVYVFVVYLETFKYNNDLKYIVVMNNQDENELYVLSVVYSTDNRTWGPAYVRSLALNDDDSKKE